MPSASPWLPHQSAGFNLSLSRLCRNQLEAEAAAEVRAGDKAYKKERRAKQMGGAPKDEMGKSLW